MTPAELRAWRKLHGLTQAALAERLPVSKRAVEEWESRREPPRRRPPAYLIRALRDLERELTARR